MMDEYTYVSLFSSAGVGCYGFHQQGFKCILTSELLEKRLEFQKINNIADFPQAYLSGDINRYDIPAIIKKNLMHIKKQELDVLIATPPCQGISLANHKKNDKDIHRNSLVVKSVNCIDVVKPRVFILENVQRFLKSACIDNNGRLTSIEEVIDLHLEKDYQIYKRVINFKNFGSPSSRTRCLVIGVLKNEYFSPLSIFPKRVEEKTLYDVIGDMPSLNKVGEILGNDIYHNFKSYDARMRSWISNTKEGQSAFDNRDLNLRPHRVINGKIVPNVNKNGDKYKRQRMDMPPPCIHTRNDILASQNTIHPYDDRVFSIREVMKMMGVPDSFMWSYASEHTLNNMHFEEKTKFLKEKEMNIRACLGEAVPTPIFESIAINIKNAFSIPHIKLNQLKGVVENKDVIDKKTVNEIFAISEVNNVNREKNAGFYTPEKTVFHILNALSLPKSKTKKVKILEPSVGSGNFIPYIFKIFSSYENVELDVLDIDLKAIENLKSILNTIGIPINFKVNYITADFFDFSPSEKYDFVIGNPPYGKIGSISGCAYKSSSLSQSTNIFCLFLEKSLHLSEQVALIIPKTFLSAPQYEKMRLHVQKKKIISIIDYGEKGFDGIKIETIGLCVKNGVGKNNKVYIHSIPQKISRIQNQEYICDSELPYWVVYRNKYFDKILQKMKLGIFTAFRDRQILKIHTNQNKKGIIVYKSRNVCDRKIQHTDKDVYIENPNQFAVYRKLNKKLIMVPNLTYKPRACWLPKNSLVDGSVALLEPINGERVTDKDIAYYASTEFHDFYRIARNYGTRSLNIDSLSIYFFGVLK